MDLPLDDDLDLLKMPELVLDKISSHLTYSDKLKCRRISSKFAFELFPINSFILSLSISDVREDRFTVTFIYPADNPLRTFLQEHFTSIKPLMDADLLGRVVELELNTKSIHNPNFEGILEHLRPQALHILLGQSLLKQLRNWIVPSGWGRTPETRKLSLMITTHFIPRALEEGYLEYLTIGDPTFVENGFIRDLVTSVSGSSRLKSLSLDLYGRKSLTLDLDLLLPLTLTTLKVEGLSSPPLKNSEVLKISKRLVNLEHLQLQVEHIHHDDKDYYTNITEVNEDTLTSLIRDIPSLKVVNFNFGVIRPSKEEEEGTFKPCRRSERVLGVVLDRLRALWRGYVDTHRRGRDDSVEERFILYR